MKILRVIIIFIISLATLVAAILFLIGYFKPKPGGIKISTNPSASIYINGVFVGKSPYAGTYPAGTISLKLVPEFSDRTLIPFETKITLISGIETVISRNFGVSEDESSDSILSFEKTSNSNAGLIVITKPDNAQILIDGVSRGFAPYKISAIIPAMHQITVKSPGYIESAVTVKTLAGYRLTFFAKLEKDNSVLGASLKEASSGVVSQKTFIQILDTPTGFLRVRTKPKLAGEEIAEVKPGEVYPYINEDETSGWFEIQYQEPKVGMPGGITGWVSGEYSKKVDLPANSSSSASIK